MLKYQTLITVAFQDYPAEACIEYDRHFRQLAAKDKKVPPKPVSTGLGNTTETRNYIFATANQLFCHVLAQPQTPSHTHPQELKFASALMPPGAVQEERHASSNTFVARKPVEGNTQLVGAPPSSSPVKQIIIPL